MLKTSFHATAVYTRRCALSLLSRVCRYGREKGTTPPRRRFASTGGYKNLYSLYRVFVLGNAWNARAEPECVVSALHSSAGLVDVRHYGSINFINEHSGHAPTSGRIKWGGEKITTDAARLRNQPPKIQRENLAMLFECENPRCG